MSMKLTPSQLRDVADRIVDIDSIGVEVKLITVHGHDVHLKPGDAGHLVVGISDKTQNPGGVALR